MCQNVSTYTGALQLIRNRRNPTWKMEPVTSGIKNYLFFIRLDSDSAAETFMTELRSQLSGNHAVVFSTSPSTDQLSNVVEVQSKDIRGILNDWVNGDSIAVLPIFVTSDLSVASSIASGDFSREGVVVCIGNMGQSAARVGTQETYHPKAVYYPGVSACTDAEERKPYVRVFAIWALAYMQGTLLMPYQDEGGIEHNILSGHSFDIVEQRMINDARKNVANFLYDSPEEQQRFVEKLEGVCPKETVDTPKIVLIQGYESVKARISRKETDSKVLGFLDRFKRRTPKNEDEGDWTCPKDLTVGVVLEALFGEYSAPEDELRPSFQKLMDDRWNRDRDAVTRCTLKGLCEAVKENGIINRRIQEIQDELRNKRREFMQLLDQQFKPMGVSLDAVLNSLKHVFHLIDEIRGLCDRQNWLIYAGNKLRTIVENSNLSRRLDFLNKWKTELGAMDATEPDHDWKDDPIPKVPQTATFRMDGDCEYLEAAVKFLKKIFQGLDGRKIVCAHSSYVGSKWPAPSRCYDSICNVIGDTYTYIEGIRDAELVVLSMDIDNARGG